MKRSTLSLADFHAAAAIGKRPRSTVEVQFRLAAPTEVESESRAVPFVFSDNSVDSYGDTIDAKGWQFDRSGAGTIALFGHDPSKIENIIGRAHNVRVEGNQLLGDIFFATKEENPNAEIVYQMVKGGYINSVSVGFQPIEWKQAKDPSRPGGIDFRKQKLLEISVVGIPANENAIAQARAAGIDVDRLEFTREAPKVTKRGLYAVSALAGLLAELGWLEESVEWEADYEGDGSAIPQRLADAMNTLGQILVDMTIEEVSELLADESDEGDDFLIVSMAAPTDAQKVLSALARLAAKAAQRNVTVRLSAADLAGVEAKIADVRAQVDALTRAGKVLSSANETKLRDAHAAMTGACDTIKSMLDSIEPEDVTQKQRAERLRDIEILSVSSH